VCIESGAKTALDSNARRDLRPYVEFELPDIDFVIPNVVTVGPRSTFEDKAAMLHGLRRWQGIRSERRQERH
jgi:hypothetical protein